MDFELKKSWVNALRSAQYVQGQSYLKQNDGGVIKHCCLGVLCEVAGLKFTLEGESVIYRLDGEEQGYPPITLLSMENSLKFAGLNDSLGYTFDQISSYIEEHL